MVRKNQSEIRAICNQEQFEQFKQLREDLGVNGEDLATLIIQGLNSQKSSLNLDDTLNRLASSLNLENLEQALELSSAKELLTLGLSYAIKRTITSHQSLKTLENGSIPVSSTVAGSANARILKAIEAIEHHNDTCEYQDEQRAITKSTIFKACGSNRQAIAKLVETPEVAKRIEEHNKKHGLTELTNRKGKGVAFPISI